MNSDEPLTRIAVESLRALARNPERAPRAASTPAERLDLLNSILLRDQNVAASRAANRCPLSPGVTKL